MKLTRLAAGSYETQIGDTLYTVEQMTNWDDRDRDWHVYRVDADQTEANFAYELEYVFLSLKDAREYLKSLEVK